MIKPIIYPLRIKNGLKRTGGQIMAEKIEIIDRTLQAIQTELKAPKGQYNKFGNYKYRSCEDILEAVKPILAKHGANLILTDEIDMRGDRFYVRATAVLRVGEKVIGTSTAFAREPEDKKGMDASQITGTASSYARKYALNGLLLIDDTKDEDSNELREEKAAKEEQKAITSRPQKKTGIKTEEEMKATETQTIDALALTAVKARLAETSKQLGKTLDEEALCKMVGCESLDKMTYPQLRNLNTNIDRWMKGEK